MTAPDPTRKKRNMIGAVAILLLILFLFLEYKGLISPIEWLALVAVVFLTANFWIRRIKKQQQLKQL